MLGDVIKAQFGHFVHARRADDAAVSERTARKLARQSVNLALERSRLALVDLVFHARVAARRRPGVPSVDLVLAASLRVDGLAREDGGILAIVGVPVFRLDNGNRGCGPRADVQRAAQLLLGHVVHGDERLRLLDRLIQRKPRLRLDVPAVFRYTFRRRGGAAGIDVLCGRFSGLERFCLFAHDLPANLVTQRR